MLVEPPDLTVDTVIDIVREHWDPGVIAGAYLPRGAGAHHWVCSGRHRPRWFVTADDVSPDGRLEELLDTYAAARELAARGHYAVVPTVPTVPTVPPTGGSDGGVGVVHGSYLVTVTGYLEGEPGPGSFADDRQRALVAGVLGTLHADHAPSRLRPWRPGPPQRAELTGLLDRLDEPWSAGPLGESARKALRRSATGVERLYRRFDRLAAQAVALQDGWVPTHGAPHTANVLWAAAGPVLVDWQSLRLAPRERDLRWVLRDADGAEPLSAYVAHGGHADLDGDMVELFDLEEWLWEVGVYATRFHEAHTGDADDVLFHQALLDEVRTLPILQG